MNYSINKWCSAIAILVVLLAIYFYENPYIYASEQSLPTNQIRQQHSTSQSVTFIMGSDNPGSDYFQLAAEHFSRDETEKTDGVISSCRSIECIIQHLNTLNDKTWSTINIVAHGNPHTGLNIQIGEDGHKATPKRLVQAAINNSLPAIDSQRVDHNSQINIWSCGIGQNAIITFGLKQLIKKSNGDTIPIYCSHDFVIFQEIAGIPAPIRVNAKFHSFFYKRGYRPSQSEIAQSLKNQYPESTIDWATKLSPQRTENELPQSHEFHIPVSFTKIYPSKESRPDVSIHSNKIAWIKLQSTIMDQLEEYQLDMDKFHWQVNKIIHTLDDGQKVPAIKAIGMSTALVVLDHET